MFWCFSAALRNSASLCAFWSHKQQAKQMFYLISHSPVTHTNITAENQSIPLRIWHQNDLKPCQNISKFRVQGMNTHYLKVLVTLSLTAQSNLLHLLNTVRGHIALLIMCTNMPREHTHHTTCPKSVNLAKKKPQCTSTDIFHGYIIMVFLCCSSVLSW